MTVYIERAFDRADASIPQDPGRVTARRLNRNEYTNTIRDLLGVRFRAEKYFPADDSGDGFDNIGDVLTVSPLLTERYLSAAERIARWAISTEIPPKPIEADYRARDRQDSPRRSQHHRGRTPRRVRRRLHGPHRPSRRAAQGEWQDAAPGDAGPVDGRRAIASKTVETKPSGLVLLRSVFRGRAARLPARGRPRVPRRVHRRRVREDPARRGCVRSEEEQVPRLDRLRRPVRLDHGKGEPQEGALVRSGVGTPRASSASSPTSPTAPTGGRRRDGRSTRCCGSSSDRLTGPIRRARNPAGDPGDADLAELSLPHRARSESARSRAPSTTCRRSSWLRASATSSGARCRTTS